MPLSDEGRSGYVGRRGFIEVMTATALGALLPGCSEERQALGFRPEAKRQTPFITPNGEFYLVAVDPDYRPPLSVHNVESDWALELVGLDGKAHRLGYGGL